MPKSNSVLLPVLCLALGAAAVASGTPAAIRVDGNEVDQAVLFAFDDYSIPFFDNLQLSMEAPQKYPGNPVLKLGRPGEPDEWQIGYYGTVLRINGKFRMWYIAEARETYINPLWGGGLIKENPGERFAYAESDDGIHWLKPDLGLTDFRGSRHNNLVSLPKGFRGYHVMVRYEPEEPDPTRRYKILCRIMKFGDFKVPKRWVSGKGGAYIPFYSPDGLHWRVADEILGPDKKSFLPQYAMVDWLEGTGLYKWQGMYYVNGQGGRTAAMPPYGRHVQTFRSPDFVHWSRTQTMSFARGGQYRRPTTAKEAFIGAPPIDNEQTHEGASVFDRGNVLLGITGMWHGTKEWTDVTQELGFIVSNDGLHFREPQPDFIFAHVGERGRDWDFAGIAQGQGMENVGDKTYFWYEGPMDQREGPRSGLPILPEGGIGLLVLDRDRFGSLSTRDPDQDGTCISSEIELRKPVGLWVNAEGLGPDSPLRFTLLDRAERPVPGYSGGRSAIVQQSGLRVPVIWPAGDRLPAFPGPVKLQITFEGEERNAIRLYAVYLGQ